GALHLTKTEPNTGKPLPDRSGVAGFSRPDFGLASNSSGGYLSLDSSTMKPHSIPPQTNIRSVATAEWKMDSEPDGAIGKAVISYGSSSKQLSVIVSYSNSTEPVTSLSHTVDFVNALQSEWVFVGFSASTTGLLVETHDILSWYFHSSL
ncbi:hypothetical protein PIB30_099822, partial [Stylosanthes scabra]|nr:hypothetical protein [Stylosanthes scabra]